MITGSEAAVLDANAAALGVPQKQLMESGGNAVARAVREVAEPGSKVCILGGRGNNGGDAFVAARFLDDYNLQIRLLGRIDTITTELARENWETLLAADYEAREVHNSTGLDIGDPEVIVDGMLGTGISGQLREPAATAARAINDSNATVVSVDVPSGLDADDGTLAENAVEADHVVTFHDTKPGLDTVDAAVTVADIGIPDAAERFVGPGDLRRTGREPTSYKGDHGEVLVIGGGPYTGAPALAAQAALRAGADLVRVACPTSVAHEIQSYREDIIVRPMEGRVFEPGHVGPVMEFANEHDVLVIGPGLGDRDETLEATRAILEGYTGTAVVDADALQIVPRVETSATVIGTPHQGELVQMGGRNSEDWGERRDLVETFAGDLNATLLVKGHYDIISDGDTTRVSRTGNSGMTVGGTGDVLAGTTGALAAAQEPIHAAAIAAYAIGKAGDAVHEVRGNGLMASDLPDAIPAVLWDQN